MSDKRRDHKGRVLRTGESQRADLRYQFRYKDARGNRRSIYSMDLKELRAKEEEALSAAKAGIDCAAGQVTVLESVERYTSLKNGVRQMNRNVVRKAGRCCRGACNFKKKTLIYEVK